MILDQMQNWTAYPFGPAWETAFAFLSSLAADTPDGEYPIQGEEIFARVMTYSTRPPAEAILEAHRDYVDIQTVLAGAEGMEWFPAPGLAVATPYDDSRDAEFYQRPAPGPARVDIRPGRFVVLLPQEAHIFSLIVGGAPESVRKVVVKVKASLLLTASGR